jgi:hypothetical protein
MNDKPELPGKNDFAMAFKAIALARGLSGDAKTVGAVLLAHFPCPPLGIGDVASRRLLPRDGPMVAWRRGREKSLNRGIWGEAALAELG